MATDSQHEGPAQCDVPDITFTSETTTTNIQNPGQLTPNMPILLLARPREGTQQQLNQEVAPTIQTIRTGESVPAVALLQRPLSAPTSFTSSATQHAAATSSDSAPAVDVDSPIVQALKSSKDRLYVLKLGETMENLISQGKLYAKVDLQPASSYQRLLVHRCAEFYHLTQENSPTTVSVIVTADSRIPSKRISELVPPEETVLPAFQIMRRVDRPKTVSRATSVDGNLTDEGDDTRSQGSGSKKKAYRTIEEREADYNKARSRIFMDFEEKDASSGGAMSSAASIVSYTGGSTGMSSVDGDGASTAPTESEYSAPAGRAKEGWSTPGSYASSTGRGKSSSGAPHTTGPLRSSAPPFTSPNVSPPPPQGTVHYIPDHSVPAAPDMRQMPTVPPAGYPAFAAPAMYPFYVPYFLPMPYPPPPPSVATQQPPESQGPEHHQPQQPLQPPIQSGYPMAPQPYPGYVWVPAPPPGYIPVQAAMPPPPPVSMHGPPSRPASQTSHQSSGSFDQRTHQSQTPPYQQPVTPGTTSPYILPGQQHSSPPNFVPPNQNRNAKNPNPLPNVHSPPRNLGPTGRPAAALNGAPPHLANHHPGGNLPSNPNHNSPWNQQLPGGSGEIPPLSGPPRSPGQNMDNNRASGNMMGPVGNNSIPGRGMARNPWGNYSYGPGVGVGGMQTVNIGGSNTNVPRAPDGLSIRILPPITLDNHSAGSSNGSSSSLRKRNVMAGNAKTPGDETSSVTSSSSSSSKRTFTSNASSQPPQHHPLPERPDWVLNTRPGLAQNRNKAVATGVGNASRPSLPSSTSSVGQPGTISSASSASGSDSKEFPPLGAGNDGGSTSAGGQVQVLRSTKGTTSPTSVWNSTLTSSPARTAGTISGPASLPPRPTVAPTARSDTTTRLDEADTTFERPPPKSGLALYNPHIPTRSKVGDLATAGSKALDSVDSLSQNLKAVTLVDRSGTQSGVNVDGSLTEV